VHIADIIRWFTGDEVTDAYAEISSLMKHKDFDDCGILSITLDSGVFATIDPSWSRPDSFPIWGDVLMAVIGTEGAIWIDIMGQKMNLYSDRTMTGSWECWGSDSDLLMIKSFVDSIVNGTSVEVTGEDGLAAVAVALAAYESTKRREPVRLSEIGY
jgi:predicted dehydrogenase